ncbi:hypothetical protein [Achromobacter sp. Root83]|uniref:hypothetical protein n=1 Tax=Achromobacter sp. Root83 TaxID=1736602 RepID=UPI0012E353EF|nr:hypothetical protein [Achromobacter sp. Root83]
MTWRYALPAFPLSAARPRHHTDSRAAYRRFSRPTGTLLNEDAKRRSERPLRSHSGRTGHKPDHKNPPGYRSSLQLIADHFMCGRIMHAICGDMLKTNERTCSRKLHSLTELVSKGCGLNGKGPIVLVVDVWRKQHTIQPKMLVAKLFWFSLVKRGR